MRSPLAAALLLVPLLALGGEAHKVATRCKIRVGADDLALESGDLVVEPGRKVKSAVALHGSVRVLSGAEVEDAVAVGGSVTVEPGARVRKDAVSVGGDVRVHSGAAVGKDAVSIGGKVEAADRSSVGGSVASVSIDLNGKTLAESILKKISIDGSCRIEADTK